MGQAFTRAQIEAMTPEQAVEQLDDINAWTAAGAVDGQAPVDVKRPDGHTWTRAELEGLSQAEFEANRESIHVALATQGGIR